MLDRAAIAARVPHAGRMCLLERVLEWDASGIRCAAVSHLHEDNPLRSGSCLPVWAGIEYAAQAAAVHGALATGLGEARRGVLAALREVKAARARLDDLQGELLIEATRLHDDAAGGIYRFSLSAGGETAGEILLSGRFTLMFAAPGAVR
ncbi:MAG TPA: hydroxymyristoyl-ACP dehydratase [Burkholderiales bacterium]|nr:hydroxymyristoyl-ACP dehydratase [Burkholderiales bacterium]